MSGDSRCYDLADEHRQAPMITWKPGTAWVLYSDDGPSGPCGQCMSTTCPWTILYVFKNEDEMREAVKGEIGRKGRKAKTIYGIIGDYTAGGRFMVSFPQKPQEQPK
jgi:hypothetical protein